MSAEAEASNGSKKLCKAEDKNTKLELSEFVTVTDATGEVLEIPTNDDNSLNMSTLQAAINGATGLKFKNPKTGASRTVIVDPSGSKLLPPSDGWEDKVFQPILTPTASTPTAQPASRGTDVSVKRRKMDDSDADEDSESEGRLGRKRAAESSPLPERRPVDLLVLGVAYKTTDESFKAYFETFGPVIFAEIKKNAEGNSKGFGFIQMANIEDQEKVKKFKEHSLDGRKLEVKLPEQRCPWDSPGAPYGKKHSRETVNKVFVGRLVDKINETNLRQFFEKEAKKLNEDAAVTDVFVPTPFRGFGFVTFSSSELAEKICRPGNYVVENVSVIVRLAVPKNDAYPLNAKQFRNDQGYSYGYARGGAGYSDYRSDYQHGYESPRPYNNTSWSPQPPPNSTPLRGNLSNNRISRPNRRSAASPAFSSSGIPPPTQPPQPLIPDSQSFNMVPNQIANGIDALNLNHRNPELINAAWNAFYSTLSSNGHASPHSMSPRPPFLVHPSPPPPHPGWQQ